MVAIMADLLLAEKLERLERGEPANARTRYVMCLPECASHVALKGVCGAIVPIKAVRFVQHAAGDTQHKLALRQSYERQISHRNRALFWQWE